VVRGEPRSDSGEGPLHIGRVLVEGSWVHTYTQTYWKVGGQEEESPFTSL